MTYRTAVAVVSDNADAGLPGISRANPPKDCQFYSLTVTVVVWRYNKVMLRTGSETIRSCTQATVFEVTG